MKQESHRQALRRTPTHTHVCPLGPSKPRGARKEGCVVFWFCRCHDFFFLCLRVVAVVVVIAVVLIFQAQKTQAPYSTPSVLNPSVQTHKPFRLDRGLDAAAAVGDAQQAGRPGRRENGFGLGCSLKLLTITIRVQGSQAPHPRSIRTNPSLLSQTHSLGA